MSDRRLHFAVRYSLNESARYFAWYSDEQDGVLLALHDRMATFSSLPMLDIYLESIHVIREDEDLQHYDFDWLAAWVDRPLINPGNCLALLNFWNMLSDIARSVGSQSPAPHGATAIYDKLFWACNLPAITPIGKQFDLDWSEEEIRRISQILHSGLKILRDAAACSA